MEKITGDDTCTLISFVSKFLDKTKEDPHVDESEARFNLKEATTFEREFYEASKERLADLLKGLEVQIIQDVDSIALGDAQGAKFSVKRCYELLGKLCDHLVSVKDTLGYEKQAETMVADGVQMVKELCPYLDEKYLSGIKPDKVQFNGGEMVMYEVDLMAGGQMIIYPCANEFMKEHIEYRTNSMMFESEKKHFPSLYARVLQSYRYELLFNMLHELVHCLQGCAGSQDASAWAAEHDASRCAVLFMKALATDATKIGCKYLFPKGKVEEVALYISEKVYGTHKTLVESKEEAKAGYLTGFDKWEQSWGLVAPVALDAFSFAVEDHAATDYMKYRVGLEAYLQFNHLQATSSVEGTVQDYLKAMLKVCLHERKGNVYEIKLDVPQHLHISKQCKI